MLRSFFGSQLLHCSLGLDTDDFLAKGQDLSNDLSDTAMQIAVKQTDMSKRFW